ncbi:hypothetical protein YC2023_097207 [Brassica napus]
MHEVTNEDPMVTVAAVGGILAGGDSQPVVAVDSPDSGSFCTYSRSLCKTLEDASAFTKSMTDADINNAFGYGASGEAELGFGLCVTLLCIVRNSDDIVGTITGGECSSRKAFPSGHCVSPRPCQIPTPATNHKQIEAKRAQQVHLDQATEESQPKRGALFYTLILTLAFKFRKRFRYNRMIRVFPFVGTFSA